jgi:pimeloyl-ACP methyl ester carboxylesterase
MYVRQLTQLLDALKIREPVDLAGISFGGSLITSFSNRYPKRVAVAGICGSWIPEPYDVSDITGAKALWEFFTTVFDEDAWADGQLDDFLYPEKFPDWPDRYRVQLQYKGFRRARLSEILSNANANQKDENHSRGTAFPAGSGDLGKTGHQCSI